MYKEFYDSSRYVKAPVVTVVMLAYNHADYISDAIRGVLEQKSDFEFELIIGEDCSKDETRKVVLSYQEQYPEIIKVIGWHENVGMNANSRKVVSLARGEFLAYCEGDDYWVDEYKLQDQVQVFRDNPKVGVVHTDWVRSKLKRGEWKKGHPVHRHLPKNMLQGDLFNIFYHPKILRTCTRMSRKCCIENCFGSELASVYYPFGDTLHAAYTSSSWGVGYVSRVTAVYRHSKQSALRSGVKKRIQFLLGCLEFDSNARCFFNGRLDYPVGYRLEMLIGLFLWSIRGGEVRWAMWSLKDFCRSYGVKSFISAVAYLVWNRTFFVLFRKWHQKFVPVER
ncbi:glycosyltransferase [uncultured Gilvimarinus sp.]|uniref:glycosyltransferase n=1 Tax=uncultured Gilvimarinus sp. TaxID=1689143 RepID=UPI0030D8E525